MKFYFILLLFVHMSPIKAYAHHERPELIAHRGLTLEHLENTLEALKSAFMHGADGVEFDVQLTKDRVPMVFHDRELMRLVHVDANIDEINFAKLSAMRQKHANYAQSYEIATLSQVLTAMPEQKIINIELKETTLMKGIEGMKEVLSVINAHKPRLNIIISSFDPEILRLVAQLDSSLKLGFLINEKAVLDAYINGELILNNISFIHPYINLVNEEVTQFFINKNQKLIIWGHKNMGEEERFINNAHGIISDILLDLVKRYGY